MSILAWLSFCSQQDGLFVVGGLGFGRLFRCNGHLTRLLAHSLLMSSSSAAAAASWWDFLRESSHPGGGEKKGRWANISHQIRIESVSQACRAMRNQNFNFLIDCHSKKQCRSTLTWRPSRQPPWPHYDYRADFLVLARLVKDAKALAARY